MKYTVDLIIFGISNKESTNIRELSKKELSVILVKREKEPYKDMWVLPGGYVNEDETSQMAARRVLEKETGLTNIDLYLSNVNDDVNRDPRGRTISISYIALVDIEKIDSSIKEKSSWFDINYVLDNDKINIYIKNQNDNLFLSVGRKMIDRKSNYEKYYSINNGKLGFDHDVIFAKGLVDLRNKVKTTDIVFNLMPEYFTIGSLEQVYGNILKEQVINSVFRRTISPKIEVTNKIIKTGGHRPSTLCKYKEIKDKNTKLDKCEMVDIYDINGLKTNEVISKDLAHIFGIWHSSIHLIIINKDKTKTLFQQRCSKKKIYPNMWDISVGGHILANEDDKTAVRRELSEELGLNPNDYNIQYVKQYKEELNYNGLHSKEFVSLFIIYSDIDIKNIKLQKEEVSNVKWVSKEDINKLIKNNEVINHKEVFDLLDNILK